jgi:hypothetical protein
MLAVCEPIPSRNSFWSGLFLSVFSSVEMVTADKTQTFGDIVTFVTLTDRTKLYLDIALHFHEKIELWLPDLHKAISCRISEAVKSVLLDFGYPESKDSALTCLSLPPAKGRGQTVFICDWVRWCHRISRALPDGKLLSKFGEKFSNTSVTH